MSAPGGPAVAGSGETASGTGDPAGPIQPQPAADAPRFGRIGAGQTAPKPSGEAFETLLAAGGARVERIASRAQSDPPDAWYDQAGDEFVLLLEGAARLAFADGAERAMAPGDWAIIPARCRHRVA